MQKYSAITKRYYDDENVVFLTNMVQTYRYMNAGANADLVDIMYFGTKRPDTLVFVFEKTPLVKELYKKWQAHELT
jgi:hypothetical protein